MSWPIRFLENPPLHELNTESRSYDGTIDFQKMEVGDLCFYHFRREPCLDRTVLDRLNLTAHYFAHNVGRPPLILALPDKAFPNGKLYFLVDGQCYSNKCTRCGQRCYDKCKCSGESTPRGYYDGWTVSGVPPAITVQPSVNYDDEESNVKHYHGFVTNGVVGDG